MAIHQLLISIFHRQSVKERISLFLGVYVSRCVRPESVTLPVISTSVLPDVNQTTLAGSAHQPAAILTVRCQLFKHCQAYQR
ncbi:hypothetical protein [Mariniphaga anaerophila]|uniref:hypothetical protein n=1 Tax=Mariniphaga anaerophila TaxID=1484053 RepID=UPI001114A2F4|nr:hypothetical protein [Mariniphaga anaerophila]